MEIKIYGKNIVVTDGLKSAIDESFKKLNKYIENKYGKDTADSTILDIKLEVKKTRQKVEASLNVNGQLFRAEKSEEDMYATIKIVAKSLEQQLIKFDKMRISKSQKRNTEGAIEKDLKTLTEEEDIITNTVRISKRKELKLIPMSAEDAIEQMNATGHDFYLYLDNVTNEVSLVYRRLEDEDDYGVIYTEK